MLLFIFLSLLSVASLFTMWSFLQRAHSGMRIYGPAYIGWYLKSLKDGNPISRPVSSWVYKSSKGISTRESSGTEVDLDKRRYSYLIPAPFGLTKKQLPDDSFRCAIGAYKPNPRFVSEYPIWCSGMSFGDLGATAIRALSDGTGILGDGAMINTGDGGLSIHHVPVNPEGERYRKALNERTLAYTFRFDRTSSSAGGVVKVPLDLERYYIDRAGDLQRSPTWNKEGTSEQERNVIIQIGPAMSGFRTMYGDIDWEWLNFVCSLDFVKGVELKLHQGASPNDRSYISSEKLTDEVQALRTDELGAMWSDKLGGGERLARNNGDYESSPEHLPFMSAKDLNGRIRELKVFIIKLRKLENFKSRRLLVGLKTTYCGGALAKSIATLIQDDRGPDYIQVDGSEGGAGSATPSMMDRVGFSASRGIIEYNRVMKSAGIRDRVTLIASGKIVEPGAAAMIMCEGADLVASARGPMLSVGCIQARECHSGRCPSGVATHGSWRLRGLDPTLKSVMYANYVIRFRSELMILARATGIDFSNGCSFSKKNVWTTN